MDHTPEDVGSKPTTGIIHFAGFAEAGRHSSSDVKTRATRIHIHIHIHIHNNFHLRSAAEARR